jgi:hypothetical protein
MIDEDTIYAHEHRIRLQLTQDLNVRARELAKELGDPAAGAATVLLAVIRSAAAYLVAVHHAAGLSPDRTEYAMSCLAAFDRAVEKVATLPSHVRTAGGLQ